MTTPDADLERLLEEANQLDGAAHWVALDAVLRHADAAAASSVEAARFAFTTRLDALWPMSEANEYARLLMAFSACLATLDTRPELVDGEALDSLLWAYKWMINAVTQFPGITLERTAALLDDMERRYREGGHSLHAVHQHRAYVAQATGDLAAAGHYFELMATARRDDLSDCATCVPNAVVGYHLEAHEWERAIEVATPHLDGYCAHEPQWILGRTMIAYLHTGLVAEAAAAHRRSLDTLRQAGAATTDLDLMALHLRFWALTGNETVAVPVLERLLPELDAPGSPRTAMDFATAAALVARRLTESGAGGTQLRRRSLDGTRTWTTPIAALADELSALARSIAAQFDARNGNRYISTTVEAALVEQPFEFVPLTVLRGRPLTSLVRATVGGLVDQVAALTASGNQVGAAQAQLDLAYALRNAGQTDDAIETAEEARRSLDALAATLGVPTLTTQTRSARQLLAELYERTGELTRALPLLLELATAHRADGDDAAELACLLRAVRFVPLDPGAAVGPPPGLIERLDEVIDSVNSLERAEVARRLCQLQLRAPASSALGTAAAQVGTAAAQAVLERATRFGLRLPRAEALFQLGRLTEAEEIARDLLLDLGRDGWAVALLIARILRAQGREEELAAFAREHRISIGDVNVG